MDPPTFPELLWRVHVVVPFDWQWSKNAMWIAKGGSYGRRLSPEARGRREALAAHLLAALHGRKVVVAPLFFRIHCLIPNHRGDVINCMDLVADGIQVATGLDDRWYHCTGISWNKLGWNKLQPDKPELHVWVGQADLEDLVPRRRRGRRKPNQPPEVDPMPGNLPPWR